MKGHERKPTPQRGTCTCNRNAASRNMLRSAIDRSLIAYISRRVSWGGDSSRPTKGSKTAAVEGDDTACAR